MNLTPAAQKPHHPPGNRHHHRGVSGDPAPQVAQMPDAGTSVVLLTIALASLIAWRSFSPSRRLNA